MFVLIGLRAAKINLFSCVIGLLCLFGSGVLSQELEDSLDPDEQTFVEIKLTPEGVIAFDSSGKIWRWDFNSESFKPRRGNWRYSEAPPVDQPIEARATNEKHINDSEKRVVVEFDEYVEGDIITSGKVTIRGWVKGSIRSFDRVLIAESGRVEGDIRAPRVIVKEGGLVIGEIDESSPLTDLPKVIGETISMAGLWVLFGFAIFLTVTGLLIIALMPLKLQRLTDCVEHFTARSFFVGFLFTFLMPVVIVLVAITIVGLTVIWAVPFVYLAAFLVGIVIVGRDTGSKLLVRLTGRQGTDIVAYLIGLTNLMLLWLVVALLMGSSDDLAFGFGIFFLVTAIIVTSYPIMIGVGAALLTRFGFKDYVGQKKQFGPAPQEAAAPAPPPIPHDHPGFDQQGTRESTEKSGSKPPPTDQNDPPTIFPPGSDQS